MYINSVERITITKETKMKVAYNSCFGGFNLSSKALDEFAKRKGISLTWYNQNGNEYVKIEGVPKTDSMSFYPLTKDCGGVINKIENGVFYYPDFYEKEMRTDSDLIAIIEEMGGDADGVCADLSIEEIPDGASFEIDEYDGNESIVPPRQSW